MKPPVAVILFLFLCIFAAGDLYASTLVSVSSPHVSKGSTLVGVSSPHVSKGSTLTVTKIEDTNDGVCDADCSLREAVVLAVSGDTVVFSSLFNSPQTILLTLGQIAIDKNLTITGTGPDLVDVSANLAGRVFNISGNVNVTITGMKLRDGRVGVDINDARGGAILFLNTALNGGNLNLSNMELTNNIAVIKTPPTQFGYGSAVYCLGPTMTLANVNVHHNGDLGCAITSDYSVVTITDSQLNNNRCGANALTLNIQNIIVQGNAGLGIGGGNLILVNSQVISNGGRGVGVGFGLSTNVTIENSIISGNSDRGLDNSAIAVVRDTVISNNFSSGILNTGTMYISNSAITGNRAAQGGGIHSYASASKLFITNSTISGNIAGPSIYLGRGGGIYLGIDSEPGATGRLVLVNSTVSNNQSTDRGGGIRINDSGTSSISNSIIAGNISNNTPDQDVSGVFTSQGSNLIGITTGSSGWIASDLLNVQPMLGLLADNGGLTMTHALLPGSPAINAGNNSVAIDPQTQAPLTVDQRGFLRFYGGTVDIGAFEVQPVITGTIIYGNATGSPTPRFVSGVLLSAVGSPDVSAITSAAGTYTLGGFGSGAYTVTPTKVGGANGISSFDAGLIAKHVAGIQVLTGNQLIVADVSGNGTLSSFDAGQVARYTVGINGFGSSGNWIFVPATRFYPSVTSTIAGEDFIALLMGDVSGNWMPVGSKQSAVSSKQSAEGGR